jgi:AmmeMemoRadiSam system protein A
MLTQQNGQTLLRLARQTLEKQLGQQPTDPVSTQELTDPNLHEHRGVFVTLYKDGSLRGCVGSLLGIEPIPDGVRRHVINAALHDQRFPMVTGDEVETLQIDISVLTAPQNLSYIDSDDLVLQLRPHVDGVILKAEAGHEATFLPQVWDQLPVPEMFLDHLCLKAGLSGGSWRSGDVTIQTYQVQHFTEKTAN